MLRVGKYKGKRFSEATADRGYCCWVLLAQPQGFEGFADFLKRAHGGLMTVGKHKGLFYDEISVRDPGYADWVRKLVQPSGTLLEFMEYSEHGAEHMGKCHVCLRPKRHNVSCVVIGPSTPRSFLAGTLLRACNVALGLTGAHAPFVSSTCALYYGPMRLELIAVSTAAVL